MVDSKFDLHVSQTPASRVIKPSETIWHLEIPASSHCRYRFAQLDNHGIPDRRGFPCRAPLKFSLSARVSATDIPGTWGFGFWNDPFRVLFSTNKVNMRLPTLPEAVWFFHASPQNYLSLRDDLPASGFLAATFNSKKVPTPALLLASPLLTLALVPAFARKIRRLIRTAVRQDAFQIITSVTEWHAYSLEWKSRQVRFFLDGMEIFQTNVAPLGPLSLVIWVDNQYASLPPRGRMHFGNLPNPEPAWLEISELSIQEI